MEEQTKQEIKELEILIKELVETRNKKTDQINENFQEEKNIVDEFKKENGDKTKKQRYIEISKETTEMEKQLIELNQTIGNTKERLEVLYKQ